MPDDLSQSKINSAVDTLNEGKADFAGIPAIASLSRALVNDQGRIVLDASGCETTAALFTALSGGGGDSSDKLPLAGGTMDDGADIVFYNGSKLREGTTNAGLGGNKGIAQVCSIDYELKWEAGRLYVMGQDGFTIRVEQYGFSAVPTATDDDTKGYIFGSRRILDNGDTYLCTDNTEDAAVWRLKSGNAHDLGQIGTGATETLTLDLINGPRQYGYTANVVNALTLAVPTGTAAEMDEINFVLQWTDGITLAFHANIGIPSDSAITLPKTLTQWKSYRIKLEFFGGRWNLVSLVGGFTEVLD